VTGNGAAVQQPTGAAGHQEILVNAQYIKDLSFENPRSPQILMQLPTPPAVEINIDANAQPLGEDTYEVVVSIRALAKSQTDTLFLVELDYAAHVTVRNVAQEFLPAAILVEVPRLIFPFARNVVADITRHGGFPPLLINPFDFAELLRQRAESAEPSADTV
jgi:preprotein translocase subunit SecB